MPLIALVLDVECLLLVLNIIDLDLYLLQIALQLALQFRPECLEHLFVLPLLLLVVDLGGHGFGEYLGVPSRVTFKVCLCLEVILVSDIWMASSVVLLQERG